MQTITAANVEFVIAFLLNCNKALFKTNVDDFYEKAKIQYKTYLCLLFKQPDMERKEKIRQLTIMVQTMIANAGPLAAQLTENR